MKIVIAGGGRVGGTLAARLVSEQHQVTVVERDPLICHKLFEEIGVVTVCGDATDPRVLETAGIANAHIAAGVLARDAENLAFATLVRAVSPARVMVRMLDNRYREPYRLAGVRELVEEAEVVVAKMTTAIDFPQVAGSLPLAAGDAILFELKVSAKAVVAGRTVAQVRAQPDFPRECVFIGVVDPEGRITLPDGNTQLRAEHTLILVARRAELARAVECLTLEPNQANETPLAELLRTVDFLAPLSGEELLKVAHGAEYLRKQAGEVIFKKGDPGETFYVVVSGQVSLQSEGGRMVETVKPGGFFGEIALLTGEPRATHATAATACELASVGRDDFRGVVMANPAIALEMSRILGQRLSRMSKQDAAPQKRKGLFGR
ncbi:cyclic nucleotide-binding domain-containing protein [Melittangium boletus]|uniref:Trk system potassium uptake protein TrkA n=1 Tax=Melittangium boletus DSM 14713 TaxID=1294270 RepID=A0A250ID52_9BACT|nr:cyclic nucleotide-binding domain-containing protein [Melittangium boletus]ATB29047.1 TrkA-N domain family [Melittangium boletus DSM 14713]